MISKDDLRRRIRLGEDSTLELKRVKLAGSRIVGPRRDGFADELGAMANAVGGTIVLGVDDSSKEVVGIPIESLDSVEIWVQEICSDLLDPRLHVTIRKVELADTIGSQLPIILVDVPRSLFVHKSPGGYLRRIGSSKREMSPDLLARTFQERSQSRVIRFDESLVPRTSVDDLDEMLYQRFLRPGTVPDRNYLRKLRVVDVDEGGVWRLTVAGVLMCTRDPHDWLPHAYIQAVRYVGERHDANYQLDAQDIEGPLDEQVSQALKFVVRNMSVMATKRMYRKERPQYSDRAVFEALVNAVAHRDYSIVGSKVRLHMFRDRIELYVPGSLANTLMPDSMHLRQYNRNELIVSLLSRCTVPIGNGGGQWRMMERRGDGVPIILEESYELSGQYPQYEVIDDSELRLVIWAATPDWSDGQVG